jgi:eukaryotic-like serine/threonine-protein kinase
MATPSSRRLPVLEKYEIRSELGHGGMATVYRAHDARLERDVAVKVLHPHLRQSSEVGHRFSAEARAVAKLKHPNIVEVYDVSGPDEYEQYLVVELVDGSPLRTLLTTTSPWPPEVAALLAIELLHALEHAHVEGVVHRDIKPENVMVQFGRVSESSPSSRTRRTAIKLMDFGIAKLLDTKGVTSTGQVLGSPAHMAPEQIEGGEVDERADVFGMGVLLYECMVGHLPFEGSNPAQVLRRVLEGEYPRADNERPVVGRTWGAILDKALSLDRTARFASARAFEEALTAELERLGASTELSTLTEFLDDPEGFREAHAQKQKAKLVELGTRAHARRDTLCAANDLNRALAYAPDDVELCKLAAAASRPKRTLPTWPAFALLGAALGGGAFLLKQKHNPLANPTPRTVTEPSSTALTVAMVPTTTAQPTATGSATVRQLPMLLTTRQRPHPARTIRIGSMKPDQGVVISIDGEAARDGAVGLTIPTDDQAHEIALGCKGEVCVRQVRAIPAGDKDVDLAIALELKPVTIIIEGDRAHKYHIEERPALGDLGPGTIRLPGPARDERITVTELETGVKITKLMRAGAEIRVSFPP